MIKLQILYIALWSLTEAAYISRMATINRIRGPTAFRPGVMLQRPWLQTRLVPAASHRAPYVLYRNPTHHRYAMKHFSPTRTIFNGQWKTTARIPLTPGAPEYEFVRAASSPPVIHTDGAIHTIPAPNLSLSEKPIVVIDASENLVSTQASAAPKATYEVTEKYTDPPLYQVSKIEHPIGFSKTNSLSTPELQNLVRNGAALQLASEYGLSAIMHQPSPLPIVPQQFSLQGFNGLPTHQNLLHTGAEGIVIPPNALYQPDPMFLQKLQHQLLQRYPTVEFIPYTADVPQVQAQASQVQPQIVLVNEQVTKQTPASFTPSESQKNVVQRETQENTVLSLAPQAFTIKNVTENVVNVTTLQPQNITVELVTTETQAPTTTIKYVIETNTEEDKTTPIYYAQIGQSVGNVIANGFYSALNDVRAAAALEQVEKPQEVTQSENVTTTTTLKPELKPYFVQNTEVKNETVPELKPLLGSPFEKPAESVNVAYTLLRADEKQSKVTQDGNVYAGQLVEATISEDQDFNKAKANIISRRPPLRLFAVTEKKATETPQKVTVVKAKIPPKSKLTFDDKTGEPVLRIYASYLDSPHQKEILTAKLNNMKHVKEAVTRKQEAVDNWKAATMKSLEKSLGADANQVTQFGLKLRVRSDDYIPLFEEYDE